MKSAPGRLFSRNRPRKTLEKSQSSGLRDKAEGLLAILRRNLYESPPPFEKLVGDLAGAFSRRINIQHRLVYQVLDAERTVKVIRMWTHGRVGHFRSAMRLDRRIRPSLGNGIFHDMMSS